MAGAGRAMIRSYLRIVRQWSRRLVVRVLLIAGLAVLAQVCAVIVGPYLPESWLDYIGFDALDAIFTTLATSTLAATTFSLSVMTSAFHNAANAVTPRSRLVLREDHVTQTVLAAFMGAFLFSIIGMILRATPLMGERESAVLFAFTVVVVIIVFYALIRWIHHLERLGSLDGTIDQLQSQALATMRRHARRPNLGAHAWPDGDRGPPEGAFVLKAPGDGYIQQLLEDFLQDVADESDLTLYIPVRPGTFVLRGRPLLYADGAVSDDCADRLADGFLLRQTRSFEQDAALGVTTLTEVGSRALSPGINDPQTAIDTANRLGSVLMAADRDEGPEEPDLTRLHLATLPRDDLYRAAFDVLARDADGIWEVEAAIRDVLHTLHYHGSGETPEAAKACAERLKISI